jgi:hypothetical protein
LLEAIRSRIWPVCPNMPEAEFNELTRRMAEIEYRFTHGEWARLIDSPGLSNTASESSEREDRKPD